MITNPFRNEPHVQQTICEPFELIKRTNTDNISCSFGNEQTRTTFLVRLDKGTNTKHVPFVHLHSISCYFMFIHLC